MKALFYILLSLLCAPFASANDTNAKWIQLFNGKDLSGWTPKFTGHKLGTNYLDTFVVEDGLLKVTYDKWAEFKGEFGHLFFKTPYSHYRLRATYRFVGEQVKNGKKWAFRNSGIMIHGQSPESMKLDQKFPTCIEVQLLGGNGTDERGTLNACTPGSHIIWEGELYKDHIANAKGPTFHGDQWVNIEVEVRGDEVIRHYANGKRVCEYTKPQLNDGTPLTSGTISIQAETHPIEFKSIELLPLK